MQYGIKKILQKSYYFPINADDLFRGRRAAGFR